MNRSFGENLKLSIFGQSHGPSVGMTLEGIPAGLPVDLVALQAFMERRAPGKSSLSTARKEQDIPVFSGGIAEGCTDGSAITAEIKNQDVRSQDYAELLHTPRPGHADYTAYVKFGGKVAPGGGQFSGRLTAPMCVAGGLCLQWLQAQGIGIRAHIESVGDIHDDPFDPIVPALEAVNKDFPVLNSAAGQRMQERIHATRQAGDSISGTIECAISGLPVGLGDAMFGGVENHLAQILFGIPGVKGVSFGDTKTLGSENNDAFIVKDGKIRTATNHCGGILGGITNGMPVVFRVTVKPTPSIALPQKTVQLSTMTGTSITVGGRHDPCIALRAVPVVEAAAAIAIYDLLLENQHGR